MPTLLKTILKLILVIAVAVHFFLLVLFFAPTKFLVSKAYEGVILLENGQIPQSVKTLISEDKDEDNVKDEEVTLMNRLIRGILEIRANRFMDEEEKQVYCLSVLDFGEGVIGMEAASQYYFQKPLAEISEEEWVTLINLQRMFR